MSRPGDALAKVRELVARDGRFRAESYLFTLEGLGQALERNRAAGRRGHITPQELLFALRDLARRQFGYLARVVFEQWGVRSTEDFGAIVFQLAEARLLSKQDSDRLEDFQQVFDFAEAFENLSEVN